LQEFQTMHLWHSIMPLKLRVMLENKTT
jgi:hypothetical protein